MTKPRKPPELHKPSGRPEHQPTEGQRENVLSLVGMGVTDKMIAQITGISTPTLLKHYAAELERGVAVANHNIAQRLYEIAMDKRDPKSVVACIFWLKARAGWTEFAPAPQEGPHPQPLGKKEQDQLAAETAERGTGWAGLVH